MLRRVERRVKRHQSKSRCGRLRRCPSEHVGRRSRRRLGCEGRRGHRFDGCSYLFHDDETHLSFNGTWERDGLRWDDEPFRGPWSTEQEEAVEDDAVVAEDGTLMFSPEE